MATAILITLLALVLAALPGLLMRNIWRRRREEALLISRYREKLDEWEEEGCDIFEFNKKWFK